MLQNVKLGYPRSWIRPAKDNWFIHAEGLWGLFRPFIPRCLNLEISAKEFPDITVRSHDKHTHTTIYFDIISFTKKKKTHIH